MVTSGRDTHLPCLTRDHLVYWGGVVLPKLHYMNTSIHIGPISNDFGVISKANLAASDYLKFVKRKE